MIASKFASILSLLIGVLANPCRASFLPDGSVRMPIPRDGYSVVEARDGSDNLLKHHVWGTRYIDELVQTSDVSAFGTYSGSPPVFSFVSWAYVHHWAMQDANYNVLGIVDSDGVLLERHQYSPYGKRTTFFTSGADDTDAYAATMTSCRSDNSSGVLPLCEIGHQGLMHDEESGLVYNRARMLAPPSARFVTRDSDPRVEEAALYNVERLQPVTRLDPTGRSSTTTCPPCPDIALATTDPKSLCEKYRSIGDQERAAGLILCPCGQYSLRIPCNYYTPPAGQTTTATTIISGCIDEHEQTHMSQNLCCSHANGSVFSQAQPCPGSSLQELECEASQAELACLQRRQRECIQDRDNPLGCNTTISFEIQSLQRSMTGCGSGPQPRDVPIPPKPFSSK